MKKLFGTTALMVALSLPGLALAGADAPKAGADMKPAVAKEAPAAKVDGAKGGALKEEGKAASKVKVKPEAKAATKAVPAVPATPAAPEKK